MNINYNDILNISILKGKTLTAVNVSDDKSEVKISTSDGEVYGMYHDQDCCESVYIDDIIGELEDLIGSPLLIAEERQSEEPPESVKVARAKEQAESEYYWGPESETWTFYELSTIKGSVTIRWLGSSNGYYSESVSFGRIS